MTADPRNSPSDWYDAEGRLCAVYNLTSHVLDQYLYDAGGARYAKGTLGSLPAAGATCAAPTISGSKLTNSLGLALTSRYLVDPGGEQVTELAESGSESWTHTNIWVATRLTATYDGHGLHFELADPLGTKRVQANTGGIVENWYASLPYGDDLTAIANPNCTAAVYCYTEDATEHHYTGKERDTESGNDYFGARYYASPMGRFMSPDPMMASGHLLNPQSWNRYSYSLNNPLKFVDPDGKEAILFYRAPNGQSGDYGHVFIYVRNESTGRAGVFDFYPETGGRSAIHRTVSDARRDQHAGLRIPTSDAQADRMLDKMEALTKANIPFTADKDGILKVLTGNTNDCVTTTERILGAGGISDSSISPTGLWNDMSSDLTNMDDPSTLTGNPWDASDGTRTGELNNGPLTPVPGRVLGTGNPREPDLNQFGLQKTQGDRDRERIKNATSWQ